MQVRALDDGYLQAVAISAAAGIRAGTTNIDSAAAAQVPRETPLDLHRPFRPLLAWGGF